MDLSHEIINKFAIGEPIENMTFFLGDSIAYLTDYFYDLTQMPSEMICMNGMVDFESIKTNSYISNTTFFWTNADNELKIRKSILWRLSHFQKKELFIMIKAQSLSWLNL